MKRNVEIKARLDDFLSQFRISQTLCGSWTLIQQEDVFFRCEQGRLKLRVFADGRGELIFYRRANQTGPKTSSYTIARTDEPAALREALELAYGVRAVVKKTRRLFMHGRTRIHLDQVEGLGDFLELEVVLRDDEGEGDGQAEADSLIKRLRVDRECLIQSAYVDLLEARTP